MGDVSVAKSQPWWRIYFNWICAGFWSIHITAIVGLALTGWSWAGLAFALGMYAVNMFFITAGHHRYFSHRTFKTSRAMQFVFGLGATMAGQKGPLWWAAHHRRHHKESDGENDVHSPVTSSFFWSHCGWFMCRDFEATEWDRIRDFAKYPELRMLNHLGAVPPVLVGLAILAFAGFDWLSWYLLAIVLSWHGTFTINSLAHVFGRRRYATTDDSRNNWLLALITHGEGWHNNHHHYQSSCRQGFRWYEIDVTYYVLRLMGAVGLVWDIREPPRYVVENRPKHPARAPAEVPELREAA